MKALIDAVGNRFNACSIHTRRIIAFVTAIVFALACVRLIVEAI